MTVLDMGSGLWTRNSWRGGLARSAQALALLALATPRLAAQDDDPAAKAAAVRAAIVYKLAGYLQRATPPKEPPTEFRIGVFGDDDVTKIAARLLDGKLVGTLKVKVVVVTPAMLAKGPVDDRCELLYVAATTRLATAKAIAAQHATRPLPTICELPGFVAAGGSIQMFVEGGSIRFEIAAKTLENQGVRASPQLLKLSRKGPVE